MAPKLTEMDEVVKMIHMTNILNTKNDQGQTLLVRHFSSYCLWTLNCLMNSHIFE